MTDLSSRPSPAPTRDTVSSEPDWTDQVTDLVVDTVDSVHDKITGPAITAAKAVVYGLVIAVVGAIVFALVVIGMIRLLDWALPYGVWLPYLILGSLFVIGGVILWGRRKPSDRA